MCYDQEKTQAAGEPDFRLHQALREMQEKRAAYADAQVGTCARPMSEKEMLEELFTYHPPTPVTLPKFAAINQAAKNFAEVVLQNCPRGADRAEVIRAIQDARMTANRSVALNGLAIT